MTLEIESGDADFFVQEERSETFEHLTCVGIGDIPLPKGDLTPVYCPDLAQKGDFKIEGFEQGEPGTPSFTITKPLSFVANWLLEVKCDFVGWITYGCRGQRADPDNYNLGVILYGARVTNPSILAQAVAYQPADDTRVMTSAETAFQDRTLIYRMTIERQTVENTAAANGIAFLPERCEDKCGAARGLCEEGYMALDGTMYDSEVKKTENGNDWYQTATDPFTYGGGDADDVVVVETSAGHRAVVSRGSTTMGEPAEVAIFTGWDLLRNVDVGTVAGQYINDLFYYGGTIWAACSGGYIYSSTTLGDSWVADEAGVETAQDLNAICMYSLSVGYCVGNNNVFLYTTDGVDWNTRTGPAPGVNLLSVAVNDKGNVFVGANDGNLYVSEDGGLTWTTRASFGTASIIWIAFEEKNRYVGFLIFNDGDGVGWVYRSKDGGASWQQIGTNTGAWNSGLNAGFICDPNTIFIVGEAHTGTTYVAKGVRVASVS